MAETKAIFGGELSGHIYFRDYYYADSAAVAFARMLSVLSAQEKSLGELIKPLQRYSQTGEINFQSVLRSLSHRGYQGLVELEHGWEQPCLESERRGLETLRRLDAALS